VSRFKKVAVLKGGISSEREVSLRSGAAIAKGLREAGYDVLEVDLQSQSLDLPSHIDAVFVALHGTFGEDGGIQELLTQAKIPFTGSDAASCRIAFDKVSTREALIKAGIPVAKGELLTDSNERTLSLPVVVKPPCEGSSVGCHLVLKEEEWDAAYIDAAHYSGTALVETYIPGRELTVGILDNQALPVVEICTATTWYDFDAKYVTGETTYLVPAPLTDTETKMLQQWAQKTAIALGARGFSRVDFRFSPEGKPYVLELNSIPGFTATSLLPKAAAAAGISFSELCAQIMEMATLPSSTT